MRAAGQDGEDPSAGVASSNPSGAAPRDDDASFYGMRAAFYGLGLRAEAGVDPAAASIAGGTTLMPMMPPPPDPPPPLPPPSPPPPGYGLQVGAPAFVASKGRAYPAAPYDLISEEALVLEVQLDAPGTVYYLATPHGHSAVTNATLGTRRYVPTPAEVMAGVTAGGSGSWSSGGGLASGAIDVVAPNAVASVNVTSLARVAVNDVWVVAASVTGTLQPYVSLLTVATRDVTPPAFLHLDAGRPTPEVFVGAVAVDVAAALNEPGSAFLVVQEPQTQAPTAEQVRDRARAGAALTCVATIAAAGALTGCTVGNLTEVTEYSAFYTVQDAAAPVPNLHVPAFRFDFTTTDGTPPVGSLSLGEVAGDGFELVGGSTKNGTVFWVVVRGGEPTPRFLDVKAGHASGGAAPVASGDFYVSGAGASLHGRASRDLPSDAASGFGAVYDVDPETVYDAYAVVSDAARNPDPAHVNFNTTVLALRGIVTLDVHPPRLVGAYTAGGTIAAVLPRSFDVVVQLTEPGQVWYVVTPHVAPAVPLTSPSGGAEWRQTVWADAPTPEEVVRGFGPRRSAAAACGVFAVGAARVNVSWTIRSADLATTPGCLGHLGGFYGVDGLDGGTGGVEGGVYTSEEEARRAREARERRRIGTGVDGSFYGFDLTGLTGVWGGAEEGETELPWPPEPPRCRACPWLSPEGAYDVWLIAEDDGNRRHLNAHLKSKNGTRDGNRTGDAVARQTAASRAAVVNAPDPSGPSVVMADDTPPSFAPGYPRVTALNGSAVRLEAALDEPGGVVFALRGKNDGSGSEADRARIEEAAGWSGALRRARSGSFPPLAPGASAGVLAVPHAGVPAAHVITSLPPADVSLERGERGGVLRLIDYFPVDVEPTRGSSLTPPAVPNAGRVATAVVRTADTLAPLWVGGGPRASGAAVGAGGVNRSAPGGEGGGAHLAGLVVRGPTDEPSVVFFVVAAADPIVPGTRRPFVSPGEVMRGTTGSPAWPAVANGSFPSDQSDAAAWQSEGYPLTQGAAYVAWIVAVDATSAANAQAASTVVDFTADDARPPAFVGRPSVIDPTPTGSFTLRLNGLSAPGTVHWAAVDGGAPASEPTRGEVIAGNASGVIASGAVTVGADELSGRVDVRVTPRTGATITSVASGFTVFVATTSFSRGAEHSGDGSAAENVAPTNAAKLAPGLVTDAEGHVVGLDRLTETSMAPRVTVSAAPARVATVLLRAGSPPPSPGQVLAGVDAAGRAPADPTSDFPRTGDDTSASAVNASTAFAPTAVGGGVDNLTRAAAYDLYATCTLAQSGIATGPDGPTWTYADDPPPVHVRRVVTPDRTPPFFLPGFPRVARATPGGAGLAVRVDEPAAVWAVALQAGSPTPSSEEVAAAAVAHVARATGASSIPAAADWSAGDRRMDRILRVAAAAVGETETTGAGVGLPGDGEPLVLALLGLAPGTRYDAYVVSRDLRAPSANIQARPTRAAVTTPATSATLAALTPSVGVLEPLFAPDVAAYRLRVSDPPGGGPRTVSFTATAADRRWAVTVNGADLPPGGASVDVVAGARATMVTIDVTPSESLTTADDVPGGGIYDVDTAPARYTVRVVRASASSAAADADASLAFLHVSLDDGTTFNATRLGGAAWPKCVTGCRPPGHPMPCDLGTPGATHGCVLDPAQRRYRLVASPAADVAALVLVAASPGAEVRVFDGPPDVSEGTLATPASADVAAALGLAQSVPPAVAVEVHLARVEAKAPSPGAAAVHVSVTSPDGSTRAFYTIAVRRAGVGAYEGGGGGGRGGPHSAETTPPPRGDRDVGYPHVVAPVDGRPVPHGSVPSLTYYPREEDDSA